MLSSHLTNDRQYNISSSLFSTEFENAEHHKIAMTYELYVKHLQENISAFKYLHEIRGLSDKVIERFQLGFADKKICKQFREVNTPVAFRGLLQRTGLIGPKGHQIFLGSVIIPIKQKGMIVGGVGRRISDVVRLTSTPYPFHLMEDDVLFNSDCLAEQPRCVVLCKSPMEALSALSQGIDSVISLVGNSDFTDEQAKQLKSHHVKVVKVAFDQSPYYQQKITAIAQTLKRQHIRCKVVVLPDWQDVNALCLYDPSGKALHQRIRQAQPYKGD